MKDKYYINKKTHLAAEKKLVFHHSLKINKRGGPYKLRGGRKKVEKLISVPSLLFDTQE